MMDPVTIATLTFAGVTAASKAKPALWDPLMKNIESSKNTGEIRDALNEAVEMLSCSRKDYKNNVDTHTTKVPSESYKEWIRRVEDIEVHVKALLAKYNKKTFIFPGSKLIKKMQKAGEKVGILLDVGDQLKDKLFADPRLEPVVINNKAPGIKQFATLQKPLVQILDLLKIDEVNGIGICGPLGVGKTTIMWNLNNHEEVAKMFDIVIWVTASAEGSNKNLSREHMQQDIVRRLKIDEVKGNKNDKEVAEAISKALKARKYLLLLDDVREKLEVSKIGVPDCRNGSKFVVTSRFHHVCSAMVDRVIKVTYLSKDEPWMMFQNVLKNPELINDSKIGPLAWRVCNECSGLPLLIEKVANAFKLKNNVHIWIHGLNSWRKWPEQYCEGIWEMYKLLKFCYDDLKDEWQKKCFLYGALYPEGSEINIDYLLECWAAEDFLGNGTMETLMNGHLILSHLEDVALLDKSMTKNHVTMDKIMRQVALHISETHSERKYLVETSKALQEPPDVKSWLEKNSISLGDNNLKHLPNSPECSMLSTLFLQKNLPLEIIPESFFEDMQNLRVLDLSHTGIKLLPSSLAILIGLKVLYLTKCQNLAQLPSEIVKLVQLETLDILGSGVNNIPSYVEQLTCLRCLRVSFKCGNENANQEVQFNYNTISMLSSLEELVIDVKSPEQWSDEVVENIIKEVAKLQKFKTLKVCISNQVLDMIEVVPNTVRNTLCIRVRKATLLLSFIGTRSWNGSFQFFIDCESSEGLQIPNFQSYDKYVKYCNGAGSHFPIPEHFDKANAFELVNHEGIKQLSDFGTASMNNVQGCLIESCDKIETVMDTIDSAILPNLEHLYMKNLPMLKSICKGTVQPDSQIASLTKLTTLVLTRCEQIKKIISVSNTVDNLRVLPNLKKLILHDMPNLNSICVIESLEWPSLKWPSLEELNIFNCRCLFKLPFNKDSAPELTLIKGEQHWWDELQWQKQEIKERFQKVYTNSS